MDSNPIYKYSPEDIFTGPYTAMARAIRTDRAEKLTRLIDEHSGLDLNVAGNEGVTLLAWACAHRFPATVEVLLRKGADPNVTVGAGESSAHLVATSAGGPSEDIITLLLQYGGNPDGTVSEVPAIFQTLTARKLDRLRLLLDKGADIDAVNGQNDLTLVHQSAMLRQYDWVSYLLKRGADHARKSKSGSTLAWEIDDVRNDLNAHKKQQAEEIIQLLEARGVVFPIAPPWKE